MFGRIFVLAFMSRRQVLPDFEFCGILILAGGDRMKLNGEAEKAAAAGRIRRDEAHCHTSRRDPMECRRARDGTSGQPFNSAGSSASRGHC